MIMLPANQDLLEVYRLWWEPRYRLPYRPWLEPVRPPVPRCGCWYTWPVTTPKTAAWALVYTAHRPGMVLYVKSRQAAAHFLEILPYADHPHVRSVPLEAVAATLRRLLPPLPARSSHADQHSA